MEMNIGTFAKLYREKYAGNEVVFCSTERSNLFIRLTADKLECNENERSIYLILPKGRIELAHVHSVALEDRAGGVDVYNIECEEDGFSSFTNSYTLLLDPKGKEEGNKV